MLTYHLAGTAFQMQTGVTRNAYLAAWSGTLQPFALCPAFPSGPSSAAHMLLYHTVPCMLGACRCCFVFFVSRFCKSPIPLPHAGGWTGVLTVIYCICHTVHPPRLHLMPVRAPIVTACAGCLCHHNERRCPRFAATQACAQRCADLLQLGA